MDDTTTAAAGLTDDDQASAVDEWDPDESHIVRSVN
jgi:hypothetical protein